MEFWFVAMVPICYNSATISKIYYLSINYVIWWRDMTMYDAHNFFCYYL